MKKILIDMSFIKSPGGAMSSLYNLLDYISLKQAYNNFAITISSKKWVENYPNSFKFSFYEISHNAKELRKTINDFKPDYLLYAGGVPYKGLFKPFGMMIRQAMFFYKGKMPFKSKIITQLKMNMIKKAVVEASHVFVQTDYMCEQVTQKFHIQNVIKIVWNVLNNEEVELLKHRSDVLKSKELKLFYPTYASWHKNNINLIRAFKLIQEKIPAKLYLTLPKPNSSNIYGNKKSLSQIYQEIEKLNLQNKIKLVGKLSRHEVIKLYNKTDVLVFPSLCESFGVPLLEAMAAELPIVASNIEVVREVTKDCGIYFDPLNPNDIAAKILKSVSDFRMLSFNSSNAYTKYYQGHSIWAQVFRNILVSLQNGKQDHPKKILNKGIYGAIL